MGVLYILLYKYMIHGVLGFCSISTSQSVNNCANNTECGHSHSFCVLAPRLHICCEIVSPGQQPASHKSVRHNNRTPVGPVQQPALHLQPAAHQFDRVSNKTLLVGEFWGPKNLHSCKYQLMYKKNNLSILSDVFFCLFIIRWFMGAAWIILGLMCTI